MDVFSHLSWFGSAAKERAMSVWKAAQLQIEHELQWLRGRRRPVDFVSATAAELGARAEATTSKDNAMTVSAALYDEYKQL